MLDISAPTIAGYSSRARAIVNAQRAIGIEPVVLTSVRHKNVSGAEMEVIDNIKHYRTLKPTTQRQHLLAEMYWLRQRILEVARLERVDLIHAHSPVLVGIPAWMSARQLGLGCVYEIRALWEDAAVEKGAISEQSLRYRLTRGAETFLKHAKDAGLASIDEIALSYAPRLGLPAGVCANDVEIDVGA